MLTRYKPGHIFENMSQFKYLQTAITNNRAIKVHIQFILKRSTELKESWQDQDYVFAPYNKHTVYSRSIHDNQTNGKSKLHRPTE